VSFFFPKTKYRNNQFSPSFQVIVITSRSPPPCRTSTNGLSHFQCTNPFSPPISTEVSRFDRFENFSVSQCMSRLISVKSISPYCGERRWTPTIYFFNARVGESGKTNFVYTNMKSYLHHRTRIIFSLSYQAFGKAR
jgi:hypothetical protein